MIERTSSKKVLPVKELEDTSMFGYSQCLSLGKQVFIAGQCGLNNDHEIVSTEFEPQARASIERIRAAVTTAGGSLDNITSMTVFVTDIRYGLEFTRLRREYFRQPYPTSALIGVSSLMAAGALIEIQATAVLG